MINMKVALFVIARAASEAAALLALCAAVTNTAI
jgi:hypothetical protein